MLRTSMEKLLKNRDMAKGHFLAKTEFFMRENGDMGRNMDREPRTGSTEEEFFILVSGVLTRTPPVVKPMGKENDSTVKTVTYTKESFVWVIFRDMVRCTMEMMMFTKEIGAVIRKMGGVN